MGLNISIRMGLRTMGSLLIDAHGGVGGAGVVGRQGSAGRDGRCGGGGRIGIERLVRASGDGGRGGKGGTGGKGGDGGNVRVEFWVPEDGIEIVGDGFEIDVAGGEGGRPGEGGRGGPGGTVSCFGGGDRGETGPVGAEGDEAMPGTDGEADVSVLSARPGVDLVSRIQTPRR